MTNTLEKSPAEKSSPAPSPVLRLLALGLFCFVASFFGAWVALKSGAVQLGPTTSIAEKRHVVSQESELVADVAKRVSPSVVSIVTESQAALGFRTYTQQGAGTGIIISTDGYVLTNRHVVNGTSSVQVVMTDGTKYENVKVVGTDPANDIAFLKIEGAKNLPSATIGDSAAMEVGDKVIAIGNALGQYQTSVTSGIISGINRPVVAGGQGSETEQLSNLFQTDAAINPGNSGGPLVNLDGQIIGINTAIDQNAEGIGFAIPINDAKGLIKSVTTTGKLERAYLGVTHVMLNADIAKHYNLEVKEGAYITNDNGEAVAANSPAARAGVKAGDIVTAIDGKPIGSKAPLISVISQFTPGSKVSLELLRGGKKQTLQVTLGSYPAQ